MAGYTKLWSVLLTSSIWNADDKTRILWVTMLAAKEADHVVRASVGGLAHLARLSKEDCEKSLEILMSPDEDSRSKEFDGIRVKKVDGGFEIVNGDKYRDSRNDEERKEYMSAYMREYRKKNKLPRKQTVNFRKQRLTVVKPGKSVLAHAESESESEKKSIPRNEVFEAAESVWAAYPKKVGKKVAIPQIVEAIRRESKSHGDIESAANFIMGKVQEYAQRRDPEYYLDPIRFFRDERYNDDPSSWKGLASSKPQLPTPRMAWPKVPGEFVNRERHRLGKPPAMTWGEILPAEQFDMEQLWTNR